MTTTTTFSTFCKALKKQLLKEYPQIKSYSKRHVPGCGYVYYMKDSSGNNVVKVSKPKTYGSFMTIYA